MEFDDSKPNSDRYSRQILFSGIGKTGQEKLRSAKIIIIGCGALGTMQAEMLARLDRHFEQWLNP